MIKSKEKIAQFLQSRYPSSPEQFSSKRILSVQTLRNDNFEEQLLLYYSSKHEFYGCDKFKLMLAIL